MVEPGLVTDSDEELSAARLGRTVGGRWLLERVLGIGGMGTVYAARGANGAVAAVKILHPEMSVRREIRERFLREGYVANRIAHAGVVQALEHGDSGDEVFLVMELLDGETLRARVKRHGKLPVGEVLDYADQILDVLATAHERSIVHRDLKPDNLFVVPDGRIKILDFGLARVLDDVPSEHRTRTGVALGTLAYMAPEQALGRRAEIDGRVDLFALGATMFRILSGRRVHEAESEAELLMAMASRPAPPLASMIPGISPAVAGVVDLALAFSRDARYPDARTMQGDVRALRQGQPGPYASARLSSREEATRADSPPMMSQRTQPLSATMPSHLPGTSNTMPMPAAGVAGYGGFAAMQAPASVRTAPLVAHPAAAYGAGHAPGAASFGTTMPSTPAGPPAFVASQPVTAPAKTASRGSLGLVVVLGFAGLAVAGGGAAWYYLAGSNAEASATATSNAAPLPASGAPAGSAPTPTGEAVPAVTTTSDDAPGSAVRKSTVKKDAAAPSASVSAAVAPSAAPSAGPAAPAPAAPTASTAAPASPDPPAPPSPSVAPPAPNPGNLPAPPPPTKRGRNRGKNG